VTPELPGLREQKKARTRETVQRCALDLFAAHGYAATTIDQIAAAAEISPSTFFRYFPTKEDVVLADFTDAIAVDVLRAIPRDVGYVAAIREMARQVWSGMPPEKAHYESLRHELISSVPELRARMLDEYGRNVQLIASMVSEREGGDPDDPRARAIAGAVMGVMLSVLADMPGAPMADHLAAIDARLAVLEGLID